MATNQGEMGPAESGSVEGVPSESSGMTPAGPPPAFVDPRFAAQQPFVGQYQLAAQPSYEPFVAWAPPQAFLQLPVASLGKRILAYLIDSFLEFIVVGVPLIAMVVWLEARYLVQRRQAGGAALAVLLVVGLVTVAIGVLYRPVCEAKWGKTIGKALVKIRVVMEDGRPCTGAAAVVRYLLFVVDGLLSGIVGLIIAITDETGRYQRLGDRVAHTVVVDDVAYQAMRGIT